MIAQDVAGRNIQLERDNLQRLAQAGAAFTISPRRRKHPTYEAWQTKPQSLGAALAAHSRGENIGFLGGELSNWLIPLDFDQRADEFQQNYPALCNWRAWRDNDLTRVKSIVRIPGAWFDKATDANGKTVLEVLAKGHHAIVAGVHKTGAPIRMELIGDVPEITVEQLSNLFRHWTGKPYEKVERASKYRNVEFQTGYAPGDTLKVRILLDHIASWRADDYAEWIKVGFAVKQECGDAGFDLWDQWSSQSKKYDPEEAAKKWNSFPANGRVTGRTLYYLAAQDSGLRLDGAK